VEPWEAVGILRIDIAQGGKGVGEWGCKGD